MVRLRAKTNCNNGEGKRKRVVRKWVTVANDLDEVAIFALSISNLLSNLKHKDHLRDVQWHLIDLRVVKFCMLIPARSVSSSIMGAHQPHSRSISLNILVSSVVTKLMTNPFLPNCPPDRKSVV